MKLPPTFKKDFTLSKKSKKELIETFDIPRVKSMKLDNFPKIWYENNRHFSKLSKIKKCKRYNQT